MTILISGKLYQILSETRVAIHPDQPPKGQKLPQMYYMAVKTGPIAQPKKGKELLVKPWDKPV